MLIVFDGVYSVGKSTIIRQVDERLRRRGPNRPVMRTESNSSEIVGDLIRGWKRDGMLGAHSLLFAEAADLAYRWERHIGPGLEAGATVIADRYVLSTMARAIIRGADPGLARAVFEFAPREALTVLVECPPRVTLARRKALGKRLGGYHSGRDFRRTASVEDDFVRYQGEMMRLYRGLAVDRGPVLTVNTEQDSADRCAEAVLGSIRAAQR